MKILYDHDPDGIGSSIDAPPDEYHDLVVRLLQSLRSAGTREQAARAVTAIFPAGSEPLVEALWAEVIKYRDGPIDERTGHRDKPSA
jgi:hypothetical protein